jgi:hypothetical protein
MRQLLGALNVCAAQLAPCTQRSEILSCIRTAAFTGGGASSCCVLQRAEMPEINQ